MAKKAISVTQLKMYESMIEHDFAPLMSIIKEYRAAIQEAAHVEVSKAKGLYELKILQAKLKLQLEEVDEKIKRIAGYKWDKKTDFNEAIARKVDEMLSAIGDGSLATIEATYEHFLRRVRLAGVADEVRGLFETELPAKIAELLSKTKNLPPPPQADTVASKILED